MIYNSILYAMMEIVLLFHLKNNFLDIQQKKTTAEALRSEFVKIVSANWNIFSSFFPDSTKEDLQKFLKTDHWDDSIGDAVVLVLARLHHVHVRVYTPEGIHDHPYYDEFALAVENSTNETTDKKDDGKKNQELDIYKKKSLEDLLKHGKYPILHLVRHGAHWDSTDPFGTKVEEVKDTPEIIQLRQMFPTISKTAIQSALKSFNGDVEKTTEALLHSKDVEAIKKILPQKSDGEIMEALRLRFYKVDQALQYLMPDTSSSFFSNPSPWQNFGSSNWGFGT